MDKLGKNLAMSVKKFRQEVTEVRRELTGAIKLTSQVVEQRLVGPNKRVVSNRDRVGFLC